MKKVAKILMAAFIAVTVGLVSCGSKTNADLIKDYEKKSEEAIEALQKQDMDKLQKISGELQDILLKLDAQGMSEEEKAEISRIDRDVMMKATAASKNIMDNAMDQVNDIMDEAEGSMEKIDAEAMDKVNDAVEEAQREIDEALGM